MQRLEIRVAAEDVFFVLDTRDISVTVETWLPEFREDLEIAGPRDANTSLPQLGIQDSHVFNYDIGWLASIELEKIEVAQWLAAGALLADMAWLSLLPRAAA